jgi:Outer membrane protein beta-barrel domain
MTPKFILPLLLTIFTISVQAQFRIYGGGGANFSNIDFKNVELPEINGATNYFISVRPEIGLTEQFSVGLDIQFSQKGYYYDNVINAPVDGYRFAYLDLIPQVQYRFIKPLALFGGVGIGIRTSEKYNIGDVWREAKDKLSNSSDFSYVVGLRIFLFKKLNLHAQFAGGLGSFVNVEFTDQNGLPVADISSKLNNIQIGIGYQIF